MPATIEASDRRFLTETASTRQKLRLRYFSGLQSVTIFASRWGVSGEGLILEALGDSDDGTAPGLSMAVYNATDDVTKSKPGGMLLYIIKRLPIRIFRFLWKSAKSECMTNLMEGRSKAKG
jgi:hypothetical protein